MIRISHGCCLGVQLTTVQHPPLIIVRSPYERAKSLHPAKSRGSAVQQRERCAPRGLLRFRPRAHCMKPEHLPLSLGRPAQSCVPFQPASPLFLGGHWAVVRLGYFSPSSNRTNCSGSAPLLFHKERQYPRFVLDGSNLRQSKRGFLLCLFERVAIDALAFRGSSGSSGSSNQRRKDPNTASQTRPTRPLNLFPDPTHIRV